MEMEKHIPILGGLYIAMGGLFFLPAIIVAVVMTGIGIVAWDLKAFLITSSIGSFVTLLLLCLAIPCILGGVYFIKRRQWARSLLIVLGIVNLLNFPIGTALGIYTLWVLFNETAQPIYAEEFS